MPYSAEHKKETRAAIVEAARILFNQHGFDKVTIDMVMNAAGLTRGGFYNHFSNKEELHSEAVFSFLHGRGAQWRAEAGIGAGTPDSVAAKQMLKSYLSDEHLGQVADQCPMIALPSDVARAGPAVQASYQQLLEAMVWLYETSLTEKKGSAKATRQIALSLAALSVGGMVLARTLPESALADEVRSAAYASACEICEW